MTPVALWGSGGFFPTFWPAGLDFAPKDERAKWGAAG